MKSNGIRFRTPFFLFLAAMCAEDVKPHLPKNAKAPLPCLPRDEAPGEGMRSEALLALKRLARESKVAKNEVNKTAYTHAFLTEH